MTVDLKWNDAVGVALNAFTDEERKSGWPSEMLPHQLTALQRPFVHTDPVSIKRFKSLHEALARSCELEVLPRRKEVEVKTWTEYVPKEYTDHSELVCRTETYQEPRQRSQESTFYWVKPNDFAAWLRTQGEEPSQYIAHWFKVRGVAAPAVLQLTPPAPAVDDAAKADDTAPAIPTTWVELVAWPGRKEPGFVWTDNLRQIVATEKSRRSALAHTGITAAMGAELGCTARHINDLINGIGKSGSRKRVLDNAMARMGNGTSSKSSR